MIVVTEAAERVIRRGLELAGGGSLGVRLRMAGGQIRPRFQAEPAAGDSVIEVNGLRVFVAADLGDDVEIDVSPEHDELLVRRLA